MTGHVSDESHVFEARYTHQQSRFGHGKTIHTGSLQNLMTPAPYGVVLLSWSRVQHGFLCIAFSEPARMNSPV